METICSSAIILAAGKGTRMRSALPKPLHKIAGLEMIGHAIRAVQGAGARQIIVVTAPEQEAVRDFCSGFAEVTHAVQPAPRGTGDAVACALPQLPKKARALVVFADTPLIRPQILQNLAEAAAPLAVLGFHADPPDGYGRIVLDGARPRRIVEQKDAAAATRKITLCNGGAMAFDAAKIAPLFGELSADNAAGEIYLPDLVARGDKAGHAAELVMGEAGDAMGVDTRGGLARAEGLMQARLRAAALLAGVTLEAPETVFLSYDTELAEDVYIEPYVKIGIKTRIERGAHIRAFSHISGAHIAANAQIGPFARLREGTHIGAAARIGNFVETKKTRLGAGAKANHLSYLGDAEIGENANIGAGVITCNYDGYRKSQTIIGAGAFIGSNSSLIAPINIGTGAYLGSGSAVSDDIAADTLTLTRAERRDVAGWAIEFRAKNDKQK